MRGIWERKKTYMYSNVTVGHYMRLTVVQQYSDIYTCVGVWLAGFGGFGQGKEPICVSAGYYPDSMWMWATSGELWESACEPKMAHLV